MRALKLAGVVTCSLVLSVTTAAAAPQVLDDDALDGVVAGNAVFPGRISSTQGIGLQRQLFVVNSSLIGRPASTPGPVVVPLDSDSNSQGNTLSGREINGGGLVSSAFLDGSAAEAAAADPTSVYPGTQTPIFFPNFPNVTFPRFP